MEDDLQKRNTDCVYFLASPLTCKKGMECEFRHSEIARLNPRDCWYWLSGTCLNPTCAFRHPPIEGRSENPAEQPASQPPAPVVIKNNVPCYFYFNGYCNKGDNCPFLHSSQSSKSPSSLTTTTTTTTILETSKTFATTQGVLESTEQSCLNNEVEITPQVLQSLPPSPQVSLVPEIVKSEVTLLPEIESSEEHLEIDPEERWESSPGFDVLVDDGSEQIGEEDGMLPQHFGSYDSLVFLEPGVYDEHLEDNQMSDHARREIYPKKRQLLSRDFDFNGTDLRNHLQKRRRITSHPRDGRDHERQYGRVRGRLASEVTSDRMVSRSESESDSLRRGGRSQHRHNSSSRSKHKDREKRRRTRPDPIFSDDKIRSRQDGQCNQVHGISFTGPKTLAQIKEEKRKKAREENFDSHLNGNLKEKSGRRDDVFDDPENDNNDLGFNDVDDLIC